MLTAPGSARPGRAAGRRAAACWPPSRTRCEISLSGSFRSPNRIAPWPALAQASTQAGVPPLSMRCTHSVQPSTQPLPRGTSGFWSVSGSCTKRARLVGAGHHAVAAADAAVAVDQHDAVGALERGAGRADVDAGRLGAVLAHHRQRGGAAGLDLLDLDLADPLRRGRRGPRVEAVLGVAGADAVGAAAGALRRVDQQAPAHLGAGAGAGRARPARSRSGGCPARAARRPRRRRPGRGTCGGPRALSAPSSWLAHGSAAAACAAPCSHGTRSSRSSPPRSCGS